MTADGPTPATPQAANAPQPHPERRVVRKAAVSPRAKGTASVNRWLMPVLGVLLLFGTIGVAQATDNWVTSGRTVAGAGSRTGAAVGGGSERTVAAGSLRSADLKGWMTLRDAADGLGMPLADLLVLVGAPAGSGVDGTTAFKDLERLVPGFSLTDFRPKVAAVVGR